MEIDLCFTYTKREPRDITQEDIAKFRESTELSKAVIKNQLPEGKSLCFLSCFVGDGTVQSLQRWRTHWVFMCCKVAAAISFFPPPCSFHLLLWSLDKDRHVAQGWTVSQSMEQVAVEMNCPPLPLVHESWWWKQSRRIISQSWDLKSNSEVLIAFLRKHCQRVLFFVDLASWTLALLRGVTRTG